MTDVDLNGANLAFADLTETTLVAANLTNMTWSKTICPVGTYSDIMEICVRIIPDTMVNADSIPEFLGGHLQIITGKCGFMQRPGYQPSSPYVAPRRIPSPTGKKRGSLVMITPKEVIEIAVTYIGVIAVCSLIHYVLVEIHRAILEEFSSDEAELIAGFIQALDYAFIISATIAVLIKLFSDTWGAMNYLQIINSSEANKNT